MPPQPYEEVQPLVIRVNLGDTVKVCFSHKLNRRLSIHVQGLDYDVMTSDGTSTGFNQDSTTENEIVYTWYANTEGVFLFHDMADPRSSEDATNIHGLFGAVIVEPPEAKWFHPETGEEIESGLMADIRKVEEQKIQVEPLVIRANTGDCIELRTTNLLHGVFGALIIEEAGATFHNIRDGKELRFGTQAVIKRSDGSSFREFALFVHDFAFLFDKDGKPLNAPEVPGSHDDSGVMGINYRAEPMRERLKK